MGLRIEGYHFIAISMSCNSIMQEAKVLMLARIDDKVIASRKQYINKTRDEIKHELKVHKTLP